MCAESIAPHGGALVELVTPPHRARELKKAFGDLPSWTLTPRQYGDLEMLAIGGFSPLTGFLNRTDYEAVLERGRLADGTLWPLPICLDLPEDIAQELETNSRLVLRDSEGVALGVLTVTDVWQPDLEQEAEAVYGTADLRHPGVAQLRRKTLPFYAGGLLECVQQPEELDFPGLRLTPAELRKSFAENGWKRIVAFQTRGPIHRAQHELTTRVMKQLDAALLINPVIGIPDPGENKHYALVRSLRAALQHFPDNAVQLSLLPLASRLAGPREALLHAIIQQNNGCTHVIAGPELASPPDGSSPRPFYGPYEARDYLVSNQKELSIQVAPVERMVFLPGDDRFALENEVSPNKATWTLYRRDLVDMLERGMDLPSWFTWPEVEVELRTISPPLSEQGFTVFVTGLPSSGKSTIARMLRVRLLEFGGRQVTLLDGDVVRTHLSKKLGFSKEDRDINIRRIGFVASEITKNGGVAICAPIAPYDALRKDVREMISARGGFVLIHVSTPLEVCEQRDRKGLYAKARAGLIKEFTGISDPYEEPEDAELAIDTSKRTPSECVDTVIAVLRKRGFLP